MLKVKVFGSESYEFIATWGVTQRALTGVPFRLQYVLFVKYIIVAMLSAHCLMFADDIQIFTKIRNVEDSVCFHEAVGDWCEANTKQWEVFCCYLHPITVTVLTYNVLLYYSLQLRFACNWNCWLLYCNFTKLMECHLE